MLTFFGLGEYLVDIEESINTGLEVGQINCYPNPFVHSTTIEFSLNKSSIVNIEIYDLSGNLIKQALFQQQLPPGSHSVQWDATNERDRSVSPGIYIYQVKSGNNVSTGKLVKME